MINRSEQDLNLESKEMSGCARQINLLIVLFMLCLGATLVGSDWVEETDTKNIFDALVTKMAPEPTATSTPTITLTPTLTATSTFTATATVTSTPTFTSTPTSTYTATLTPTYTETSTATPTATFTPTITLTPSMTPELSSTPSMTPTETLQECLAEQHSARYDGVSGWVQQLETEYGADEFPQFVEAFKEVLEPQSIQVVEVARTESTATNYETTVLIAQLVYNPYIQENVVVLHVLDQGHQDATSYSHGAYILYEGRVTSIAPSHKDENSPFDGHELVVMYTNTGFETFRWGDAPVANLGNGRVAIRDAAELSEERDVFTSRYNGVVNNIRENNPSATILDTLVGGESAMTQLGYVVVIDQDESGDYVWKMIKVTRQGTEEAVVARSHNEWRTVFMDYDALDGLIAISTESEIYYVQFPSDLDEAECREI